MFKLIYIKFGKIFKFIGTLLTRSLPSNFEKVPKLKKKNWTFSNFRVTFLRSRNVTNGDFLTLFSSKFNVDSNATIYFSLSEAKRGENGHFCTDVTNHWNKRVYSGSAANVLISPLWFFWNSFFGLILLLTGVSTDIYQSWHNL